ncbi:MAG: helix-turn-helix transcriptional regulator, partial [Bacteroidales bacterium]|nr:helix-turn-helix transcriptional regulator [Bacteroidales bacterium]
MINLQIIKRLCNEAGITLKKLSDKTKISQTALTMAMQRNSTTLETLEKIAKYFRVSVGVFFGEEDIFTPIRNSFDNFDT